MDFFILDFKEDLDIPILLGRTLLVTSKSTIDIENNELVIKIDGEVKVFKCDNPSKDKEHEGYLVERLNALFYCTSNDLDQRYSHYRICAGKHIDHQGRDKSLRRIDQNERAQDLKSMRGLNRMSNDFGTKT